ncbi:ABC transporter ATP-binding protein, partial [Enterococcus malodoratus]|uniref:ABC transporter ATP-binding protein n=1 Tax=Enterococcus malodoratus TaxID=71451 RepID=UPI0039B10FCB
MAKAIELRDVSLSLNQKQILNGINLTVQKGTIYGFLGPNGAGKTTLMKVILNLLHTNQGLVEIFEKPITNKSYEYLRHIGSIIETPVFYNKLTVYENMKLHCDYLGIYDESKIDKKLKLVDMTQARDKKVKELSLGMKQRLAIARTLISEPELLILDEPINGLDPFGIKEIRELLIQINRQFGTTIFISSHI